MPHPNYILIYDRPEFFRIYLSRENERAIVMYQWVGQGSRLK
ncbi:hypothetical protein [Sphingomonas sp. PB4P5]